MATNRLDLLETRRINDNSRRIAFARLRLVCLLTCPDFLECSYWQEGSTVGPGKSPPARFTWPVPALLSSQFPLRACQPTCPGRFSSSCIVEKLLAFLLHSLFCFASKRNCALLLHICTAQKYDGSRRTSGAQIVFQPITDLKSISLSIGMTTTRKRTTAWCSHKRFLLSMRPGSSMLSNSVALKLYVDEQ